jgi:hypothetical protein
MESLDPSSLMGHIMLFFMARVLDVSYPISRVRAMFGYRPTDDAPELPN